MLRIAWGANYGLDVAVDPWLARRDKTSPPTPDNALDRPSAARSGSAAGGRTPGCCTASQWSVAQPRSAHFAALAV